MTAKQELFKRLDDAIVSAIAAGSCNYTLLMMSGRLRQQAGELGVSYESFGSTIAARLQALRKKNTIRYSKGIWEVRHD